MTELLPLLILSFFSLFRTYANTTRHERKVKTQVYKKECAGLDRLNPLKSFFLSVLDGNFPRFCSRSYLESWVFSVPHGQKQGTLPNLKHSNSPFSLATAVGSGDSVKTGQREPMGLWVALSASVRDTVHTYRLYSHTGTNKLKSPYGNRAEGDLGGDGMVHP